MLDESYPTFYLKPAASKIKHHESFLFTQHGSPPDAQYSLNHVDPASTAAKNTYAVALYDSHSPEILYGEVLAKPGWTHPTLSQDEIRKNGGVPPPPQPIYPTEFAIQLYNPDTQVIVKQQKSQWSGTMSWEFSLPQVTFRTPSASTLDRTQSDPGTDANTPRVNFVWRKEGRMGKDMTCYMTGKSTDLTGKKAKKSKEPDIVVAMFSGLKEVTIMESNLYRVELEDYKGLEVALLLGAAVIRDLFFSDAKEQFHIVEPVSRKLSGGILTRKASSLGEMNVTPPVMTPQPPPPPPYTGPSQYPQEKVPLQPAGGAAVNAQIAQHSQSTPLAAKRSSLTPLHTQAHPPRPQQTQQRPQHPQQPPQNRPLQPPRTQQRPLHPQQPRPQPSHAVFRPQPPHAHLRPQHPQPVQAPTQPPRTDPRTQWEIDAETARLAAQVEIERKKADASASKARRKQEAESERKTLQFLEQERKQKEKEAERADKERRRKQADVDRETERLRRQFGDQRDLLRPNPQPQRHSAPSIAVQVAPQRPGLPFQQPASSPYLAAPGGHKAAASHSGFFAGGANAEKKKTVGAKKSFWGLRTGGAESKEEKLKKKKSSMF